MGRRYTVTQMTDNEKDTAIKYPGRRCVTGKHGWPTKKAGKQDLRRFSNQQARRLYKCGECGQFHATSMKYMEQVAAGFIEADQ